MDGVSPTLTCRLLFSVWYILVRLTMAYLSGTYFMQTLQSVLHPYDLTTVKELGITAPNLQVRKLRLREVNDLPTLNS